MKKRKINLGRKLQLQKQIIGTLSVQDQSGVKGGSTACPTNKYEKCDYTHQASCVCVDPVTGIGNVSMCNPTQMSVDLCQLNTMKPCQGGVSFVRVC